ncbi:MAG: hypothetical protein A4E40_00024 [Methanoregulaceae archaeon PtaU1.Bin059]|nr:MAG: hypothetical protein A4E39_00331 [Methanoregulaceae archaeon PtaB.Bin152]OPY43807.1 MAG: hypothetical protein A4E40_00024 [Methanoregulaceae archaeon PtaU1.Bin059]
MIIIGTSIDHFTNLHSALDECYRILEKNNGKLIIWSCDINTNYCSDQTLLSKILNKLSFNTIINFKTKLLINSMEIPDGATDHFHFQHISIWGLLKAINISGFSIEDFEYHAKDLVFILASPNSNK